jgi:protein-tyrosine-phosphatase
MKRVLFIDIRNSVRSVMAEAWFNRLADGCGVAASCGTMPASGMDQRTVQVMREAGINLRGRIPLRVDQATLTRAHLVVLMGPDIHPEAFAPTYVWDFQDLTGCPVEDVRRLSDQIRLRVQKLIAEIQMENLDAITTRLQWQTLLQYILS